MLQPDREWRPGGMLNDAEALALQVGLFKKALALVGAKRLDYSGASHPYRNFYRSESVNVPAWQGSLVRLMDKVSRVVNLMEKGGQGAVKDESMLDTAADLLNYTAIFVGLAIEHLGKTSPEMANRMYDLLMAEAQNVWVTDPPKESEPGRGGPVEFVER